MQWERVYLIWCILVLYCVIVGGEYMGCFEQTSGLYEHVGEFKSLDACKIVCKRKDRTYYAVKQIGGAKGKGGGVECQCADQLPHSLDRKVCDKTCDRRECGGKKSQSIYSVCNSGHWGTSCEYFCFCEGSAVCQKETGLCPGSCLSGFWGPRCVKPCRCDGMCRQSDGYCDTPCPTGYWGVVCSDQCHCSDKQQCDRDIGHCPQGCAVGWSGPACSTDRCQISHWGDQCMKACHCKQGEACQRVNGSCPRGCSPGWKGSVCNTPCGYGSWGDQCSKQCHCIDDMPCDKTNGYCEDGCAAGYMGFSCENKTCVPGFWGLACNNTCQCKNNADCMRSNGLCPDGCEPGKYGPSCDKEISYEHIGCFTSEILQDSRAKIIQDSSDKMGYCRQMCISNNSSYFTVVTDTDINDKCHCIMNSPYNYRQQCPPPNLLRKLLAIDNFIIIYTVCPVGSYSTNGIDCNQYCSCPGDSNQSGLCVYDSDSGTEVCEECTGGWQGELCAQDVNECDSDDHGCEGGDCVNVPGSYHCTCPEGMQLATDYRKCVNITTGPSFCAPGYRYSVDSDPCVDIDECKEDTHGCSHGCRNTEGSFQCLCPEGQVPDPQVSCVDIPQSEKPTPKPNKGISNTTIATIAAVVGVLVILAVIVTTVLLIRRRQPKPSQPDNLKSATLKSSASNIYNNTYDTVGEEKVEGIYNTIPDPEDIRPTSDVILMENTNYESRETQADPDDKRPTSDVILMENTNYESQETQAESDDKQPTSEDIILDNTNYESQDLINDLQQSENAYHLAKETGENDENDDINNVFGDSRTVVVNGDVYNLPNKHQKIDLKENGKLLAEDSKIKDIDNSMYSLAMEGTDGGDDKGAYSLAKNPEKPGNSEGAYSLARYPEELGISGDAYSLANNPEDPGISGGEYSLANNPEDPGISGGEYSLANNPEDPGVSGGGCSLEKNPEDLSITGGAYSLAKNPEDAGITGGAYSLEKNPGDPAIIGVYNLAKNPDNADVNDVNEDTSIKMNESEKIVNGDIYRLPNKEPRISHSDHTLPKRQDMDT